MCCNNTCSSCCCRPCSCSCNDSGITTLPSFPDQPAWSGANGYPVYVSIPTFLWNDSDSGNGCGCGCG